MFIEIEKDIVEDAIAKGGQDVNESRDLLIHMALCAQQGKHYVYVPCLRKCANLMEKLSQIIGSCYVRSLDYTNRDRESAQKLKKCLCVRALMTYQEMKTIDGVILINPLTNKRFEPWTETYFLVENLIDAKLYEHILEYYKKKERIGSCLVSFYPLMGGGATTSKALEQEIELGQHFCLTIADSDMKVPPGWESWKIGETASSLLDLMVSHPFNCYVYILQRLMEIENLLPAKMVCKYTGNPHGYTKIFQMDFSLFDMKKGLTFESIFDENIACYWQSLIDDEKEKFDDRKQLKQNYPQKADYDAQVKNRQAIKAGFGDDLLKRVLGESDKMNATENAHAKDEWKDIRHNDLNAFQQKEWDNVGKILFGWTCGKKVM